MDYVALKLGEKDLDQKLILTTELGVALTNNVAIYATPDPTPAALAAKVAAITAKRTLMATAQAVVDGHLNDLKVLEAELDTMLITSGVYIQKTSGGVAAKITVLGLEVKTHITTTTAPTQVLDLKLMPGSNAGEIKSICKPVKRAKSYEYQMTLDPTKPESWVLKDTSSGCRALLSGFTSGMKIWLRVRVVGGKKTGKGPWSDPASITVP